MDFSKHEGGRRDKRMGVGGGFGKIPMVAKWRGGGG